jgi:hypothetical protein
MTMPLPVSPTPYVTPAILTAAPTGISWSTIPPGRDTTAAMKYAEQLNICQRATAQADQYCNQILRATTDTELYHGPGEFRTNIQQNTWNTRIILQRWPVIGISQVKVSASSVWPRQWTTLPTGWYEPENPTSGLYGSVIPTSSGEGGQAILIGPGYIDWALGRSGYAIQVTYQNGWPHCGMTAAALAGATTIYVDDTTGWTSTQAETGDVGATGTIYDGGQQEIVQVTGASTTSGPGTLTLAAGLQFAHETGTAVSTLPASVQWATILFGAAMALSRGATSTVIHSIEGGAQHAMGAEDLISQAELLLHPYRRTI